MDELEKRDKTIATLRKENEALMVRVSVCVFIGPICVCWLG